MTGRAARDGFGAIWQFEQLPFVVWYGVLEAWFVDAHATALWPASKVLAWLTDELPAEWERMYPDPETHGQSERARRSAARAEELYPAST